MIGKRKLQPDLPGKRTLIKSIVAMLNAKTSKHKLLGDMAIANIEIGLKAAKKKSIAWLWKVLQEVL